MGQEAVGLEIVEVHGGDEEFEGLGALELAGYEEVVEFVEGFEAEEVGVVHVLGLEGNACNGALGCG